MFYEIELLESIVQDHLCECPGKNQENASGTTELINLEKLIRKALISNVCDLKKDQLIEIYIQDIQKRLINLSNSLYSPTVCNSKIRGKRYKFEGTQELFMTVDNLLNYLVTSFPNYIDQEIFIPENLKIESISNFNCQIFQIERLFEGQKGELIEIALNPVKKLINSDQAITYHLAQYFKFFLQELLNSKGSLKEILIRLNFNCFSFLHYLTSEIVNDLEELDSYSEKMEKLYWNLKWIKQIQITEKTYNKSVKSLKDLLIDWINEEISYLEKAIALEKLPKIDTVTTSEEKEFKLITDLSVSQLGFLLRVFMDSGLFKNKNHRAVARFFARHTKTKGSVAISPGNLLNKFYDVSGNVEEVVKGIVFDMLNQIRNINKLP